MTVREELASLPLSERLAKLISDAKTDQEGLAVRLGAPRETVNRWLNHHARPGRDYRQKLAEIATQVYEEELPADLFRAHVTDRQTPGEAASAELRKTTRALEETAESLTSLLAELLPLLRQQGEIVGQLNQLVAELQRREAAKEAEGDSH